MSDPIAVELRAWWSWALGVLRDNLARTILITIVMGVLASFWKRLAGVAMDAAGKEPGRPRPAPTWGPGQLARVYAIEDLRSGLVVAPGTKLVVVDRGLKQCVLEPGTHTAREASRLFTRHAIQKSGVGLQYATTPLELHAAVTQEPAGPVADVVLEVRILEERAEKLLGWVPLRDGVAEASEVQQLIEDKVRPWIEERLGELSVQAVVPSHGRLRDELEPFLNQQVFAEHGLAATVRSVIFGTRSAEHASRGETQGAPATPGAVIISKRDTRVDNSTVRVDVSTKVDQHVVHIADRKSRT